MPAPHSAPARRPPARPCAGRAGSGRPPGARRPPGCRCAAARRRTPAGSRRRWAAPRRAPHRRRRPRCSPPPARPGSCAASRSARARSSVTSALSAWATGGGGPTRVASRAARVSLSTRRARAAGCRRSRSISSASPNSRPACGPPSSLSPLAVTRSAPSRRTVVASGSSGSSGCGLSSPEPMSTTSGTSSFANSATGTAEVKPVTWKFDGCTLSTKPVSGPIASA